MLDRLRLDGFAAWFSGELGDATITRNPVPLPELVPTASPAASATPAATPTSPFELPSIPVPGFLTPTPVATDPFGLPLVP